MWKSLASTLVGLGAVAALASAQSAHTENTLKLDEPGNRPAATIEDVAWLAGTWRGEGLGGTVEEIWSAPSGGAMMGMFKLVKEGKPGLYEFELIVEEEGSLTLKLKHFDAGLASWEEKDEYVSFPLVKLEEQAAYFGGLTYRLVGPGRLRSFVALDYGEGVQEARLDFEAGASAAAAAAAEEETMGQEEHDKRIDYVELAAPDIEAAKAFYGAVFGWSFTDWGPDYASFADGRLAGGLRREAQVVAGGPLVVIYAVELEAVAAAVREQGGAIVRDIFSFPGGRRFHFTDPAGNELAVWSDRE